MSLRIQNNVEAFNAHRNLRRRPAKIAKSMERLSLGLPHQPRGRRRRRPRPSPSACAPRSAASPRRSATSRTASRSCRRLRATSTRSTRCCSASASWPSSTRTARCSTSDQAGDPDRGQPARVRDRAHRHAPPSSTASRCWTTPRTVTFQVGANDGETITVAHDLARRARSARASTSLADGTTRHQRDRRGDRRVSRGRATFGAVQNRLEHSLAATRRLPGEPGRRREPHPRRGHGGGDGRLHQVPDPAAGRHRRCSRRPTRPRRASCRSSASSTAPSSQHPQGTVECGRPFGAARSPFKAPPRAPIRLPGR